MNVIDESIGKEHVVREDLGHSRQVRGKTLLVMHYPVDVGGKRGEIRSDRGLGPAGLDDRPIEYQPVSSQSVNMRRGIAVIPIAAEMIGAEGVEDNHKNVCYVRGPYGRWRGPGGGEEQIY